MQVARFDATEVFGYLPISIEFNQDLTFITGLNGSGKTTALRLLMGLLAPSLDELIDISFSSARAVVTSGGAEIVLKATRSAKSLELSISTEKAPLVLSATDLQLLVEARPREESNPPLLHKIASHPVIRAIRKLSTPMFLGLDRRLNFEDRDFDPAFRHRRREMEYRGRFSQMADASIRRVNDAILFDVNDLVVSTLSEIRAAQERLDENLRNQILLDSFRYESAGPGHRSFPNRKDLEKFRERQAGIEKAAAGLRLPVGKLQSTLSEFFERMTAVVDGMEAERLRASSSASKMTAKGKKKTAEVPSPPAFVVEWILNNRQADRIFKQIELLDQYVASRAKLHQPIDRFLELTNGFLAETKKTIKLLDRGDLGVQIEGAHADRGLYALSSGERQLVVMLAHLSLSKRLAESGVFIVDEPEVSLHIGWQEQFVDAIQKANPNVQLILATHSPAIILDRDSNCCSLS
jgi:predicted ATP-binding protein involved in virulence